ncbi:class I SAM-dependent methyltransferase [Synechococcus sp. PCC 7502]|uniref:class I SAM-dependent methyltransferase n=1 Tax=Synechococcus sp. PCC 7502 TaxID=1173263 RepID=UPI001438B4BA|nr:class I SAM-dependent methyltransferase [Synechococcus sp. PCC 7502]
MTKLEQKPSDINNQELPWFTYPAIEYIDQIDLRDKSVFEWGAGNSSIFFAKRSHKVISIESNPEWHKVISEKKLNNQEVFLKNEGDFVESIEEFNQEFDIIIIDSLRRYECASKAITYLKEGGIIILDNSDWHPSTCKLLREFPKFIQVDFHGFGPINPYSWTTSFFIDREAIIKPLDNIQPHYSKAAIIQTSDHDGLII